MGPLYHTNLEIPILSMLFGVVLILGLFKFGQIIIQKTTLNIIINRYFLIINNHNTKNN